MRFLALLSSLLPAAACLSEPRRPPEINSASATAGTENVLSAVVLADVRATDSVQVRFQNVADPLSAGTTPAISGTDGAVQIVVLGLHPETRYRLEVAAWGNGIKQAREAGVIETGPLPADLPAYRAVGEDATPGYVVFAAGSYGLVIDNSGRVVWYHRFPHGPGLNFMPQPNGRYVARPSTPDPKDDEPWVEVDPSGHLTRTLPCHGGLASRPHDMIALPDGSYWLLCDEPRVMDLRPLGGVEQAVVVGTAVQHIGAGGALLFEWTPFGSLALDDLDHATLSAPSINWTHGNALELTPDGAVLLSFRNLGELTAVDLATGQVRWRLGGRRSDFTLIGTPSPPFLGQHGLRLADGALQVLDNLGDAGSSRVERYRLDLAARTATLARAFEPGVPVVGQLGGSTQALWNGHTLVSFGSGGRVEEYDTAGRVVWHIEGAAGFVFRAQRVRSLYAPGDGDR